MNLHEITALAEQRRIVAELDSLQAEVDTLQASRSRGTETAVECGA